MTDVIEIQSRKTRGTGGARAARDSGFVPSVIYGLKKEPESIQASYKDIEKIVFKDGFYSKVYKLKVDGAEQLAIIKDVQYHSVTDKVVHVDFMRVQENSPFKIFVQIKYINAEKCPAIKRGGLLNTILRKIQVNATVSSIPEIFEINLDGLETRQSLTLDLIKLGEGVSFVNPNRDKIIATITGSSKVDEAASEE